MIFWPAAFLAAAAIAFALARFPAASARRPRGSSILDRLFPVPLRFGVYESAPMDFALPSPVPRAIVPSSTNPLE